jgi:hypothetical protein
VDTVLADKEIVYDLMIPDDQLVLGIKDSISVMELRTIKMRMLRRAEDRSRA